MRRRRWVRSSGAPSQSVTDRRPVTLLTSVYKGEEFLADFFRTVAADAAGYDEFIVVDNGNTDPALRQRLVEFVEATPKARLVRVEENSATLPGSVRHTRTASSTAMWWC